jgi:excisionase family DNA binding protein
MDTTSTPVILPLWTVEEVANYFQCTPRHVQNLIKGGLPHLYLGRLLRFDRCEIQKHCLNKRKAKASAKF